MGRNHDRVEELRLDPGGRDPRAVGAAFDRAHRSPGENSAAELLEQALDVDARATLDRLPLGAPGELELPMVFEELGEEAKWEVPDRGGIRGPHGRDLGDDRALAELARISRVAQELADGRGVRTARQRANLAVEPKLVADQPPEPWSQQVRALGEEATPRIGELEAAVGRRDRHPHLRVRGGDPEVGKQRREGRVVAVVVDDEAGIDPALATRIVDPDRVRVTADAVACLIDGDVVGGVQQPRSGEAGDAGADDGDLGSGNPHAHIYAGRGLVGSAEPRLSPRSASTAGRPDPP